MKIIKKGKLPPKEYYKCTCPNCETIFKYELKECISRTNFLLGESMRVDLECPFCHRYIYNIRLKKEE